MVLGLIVALLAVRKPGIQDSEKSRGGVLVIHRRQASQLNALTMKLFLFQLSKECCIFKHLYTGLLLFLFLFYYLDKVKTTAILRSTMDNGSQKRIGCDLEVFSLERSHLCCLAQQRGRADAEVE